MPLLNSEFKRFYFVIITDSICFTSGELSNKVGAKALVIMTKSWMDFNSAHWMWLQMVSFLVPFQWLENIMIYYYKLIWTMRWASLSWWSWMWWKSIMISQWFVNLLRGNLLILWGSRSIFLKSDKLWINNWISE